MRFSTGYGPRPAGGGFETFSWSFMRITAIGLIFLVIIHLFINHVTTDVACTSYQLVAGRYANPYWRVYDWLLLTLAPFYCINWLPRGVGDSVRKPALVLRTPTLLAPHQLGPPMLGV